MKSIIQKARELGATDAVEVGPGDVVVSHWVRLKCQFGCPGYGRNLTCPPHSPSPHETSKILSEYTKGLLVRRVGLWSEFRRAMEELERFAFLEGYYKAFAFYPGPCDLCAECDVEAPCRHPTQARPSMEACGIDVFATAKAAGLPIGVVSGREQEPNFYALLLLE